MKKLIVAAALFVATLVPAVAFAYPVTPNTVAVHSYNRAGGARVGSYLRRAPGNASGSYGLNGRVTHWSGGRAINVRTSVRNNPSGSQSAVRSYVRSHARTFVTTGHGPGAS